MAAEDLDRAGQVTCPAGEASPPESGILTLPSRPTEDDWLPGLAEQVAAVDRFPRLARSINAMRARDSWLGRDRPGPAGAVDGTGSPTTGGRTEWRRSMTVGAFGSAFAIGILTAIGLSGGQGERGEAGGTLLSDEAQARPAVGARPAGDARPVAAPSAREEPRDLDQPDDGPTARADERVVPASAESAARGAPEAAIAGPDLRPGLGRALRILGERQQAAGDVASALASFKRAAILAPEDAETFYDWGYLLQQKGELPGAVERYRTAIRLDPGHRHARYNLGYMMQSVGDEEGARLEYEAAVAAGATTALTHYNLGYLLQKAGDEAAALEHYRAAIAADPGHAWSHYNLGFLLERRGDAAAARTAYRGALDAAPGMALAEERLATLDGR